MNKKIIITLLKFLLVIIAFHFFLTTFIRFWLGQFYPFLNSNLVNIVKDLLVLAIIILIILYEVKNKTIQTQHIKYIIYGVILIIFISIISNYVNWNLEFFIFWFKYDIWPFIILIGFSIFSLNKKEKEDFYKFFIKLIKTVLIISLILAIIRFTYPEILYYLWFWKLWDWTNWVRPPVFYQTGSNWIQRLSGLFSWPNHFSFFLIAFWPIIILYTIFKKIHFIWIILFLLLLIWTLSRSAFLAFSVEILLISIFIWKNYKQYRKYIYSALILWFIVSLWFIFTLYYSWKLEKIILRPSSTNEHIKRFNETLDKIKEKPLLWHWLGTAWPASHYTKTNIVPESWFLQIFYEIWILGGFIWFYTLFYIIYILQKNSKNLHSKPEKENILLIWTSIGLIWLLIQGLVLHSFEDAMVVIPLFILIWILLTYNQTNDSKN